MTATKKAQTRAKQSNEAKARQAVIEQRSKEAEDRMENGFENGSGDHGHMRINKTNPRVTNLFLLSRQ